MVISSWDIRQNFIHTIESFGEVVLHRLLPSFSGIEEEAEETAKRTWEELGQSWGPDADPGMAAEFARDAGIDHYAMMSEMRQALLNWCCAGLYHLFEQHMLLLLRRQILSHGEENEPKLMSLPVLWDRLNSLGIEVESFKNWPKVNDELRPLANAVKHAEGRSATELVERRPDLFTHPFTRDGGEKPPQPPPRVFLPLAGQDLFVLTRDFEDYLVPIRIGRFLGVVSPE